MYALYPIYAIIIDMNNISFFKNLNIDNSWKDFIYKESNILELQKIEKTIGQNYYPSTDNVFRFLENDLLSIKYIILGMDPYPSYFIENGKIMPIATGRSFEVANIKSWKEKYKQKSLAMIIKTLYYDKYNIDPSMDELRNKIIEIDIESTKKIIDAINKNDKHNALKQNIYKDSLSDITISTLGYSKDDLSKINKDKKIILCNPTSFYDITELQGILWLNSTLTVEPNNSGSHMNIWNDYMNKLFKYIVSKNNYIRYLVFGEKAKTRIKDIIDKNKMIITCHPATRVDNDFVKSNCFKKMKDILLYI